MNAVEIEEAISTLVGAPLDADEFPFKLLVAIKRLRNDSNASGVPTDVLQRNSIQRTTCADREAGTALLARNDTPPNGFGESQIHAADRWPRSRKEESITSHELSRRLMSTKLRQ